MSAQETGGGFAGPGAEYARRMGITPSAAGARCLDLLSEWLGGLWHFPGGLKAMKRTAWSSQGPFCVTLLGGEGLATSDPDGLTRLVLLAHEHAVCVEIQPNMRFLRLHMRVLYKEGDDSPEALGMSHHASLTTALVNHYERRRTYTAMIAKMTGEHR